MCITRKGVILIKFTIAASNCFGCYNTEGVKNSTETGPRQPGTEGWIPGTDEDLSFLYSDHTNSVANPASYLMSVW
jgi:hypothetical protein